MATRTWITTTWTSREKARPCAASTSSLVRQTLADVDWICPSEIYFLLNIILTLYFYRRRRRRRRGRGRRWRHRGWRGDPPWVRGQRRHGRLSRCLFDLTADKLHPQHREELCLDLAAGSNNTLSWRKGGDRGMLGQFWMVSLRLEKSEIYLDLCRRGKKKLRRRGVGFCPILYLLMWLFVSFSHGLVSFFFFCFCFYRDIFCLCFVVVVFFNQKLLLVTPRFLKVTILFFFKCPWPFPTPGSNYIIRTEQHKGLRFSTPSYTFMTNPIYLHDYISKKSIVVTFPFFHNTEWPHVPVAVHANIFSYYGHWMGFALLLYYI